jgi:glucosamine-phosphate N-acetyltransferase
MAIEYEVRELTKEDLKNYEGLFETLDNLRAVGDIDILTAENILDKINNQDGHVFVAVADNQVIGAVTLLVEQKFIREGSTCGHIEDVSTRKGYEGNGIASAVIKKAIEHAKSCGCYKIILDCDESLLGFYSRFGFAEKERQMRLDL